MPLSAIIEGKAITAPDLSEEEWTGLTVRHRKGLPVRMGCCGAPGHLRVSKKGIRHFYHAADTGCHYAEESGEHLEIKCRIYRTCQSEGWETYVEFPAPDRTWISDVYAIKDGRKIVFEIQISKISPDDLEDRDRKYRAEGIESYWLLDNFLDRSKDFKAGYDSHLSGDNRPGETIPYIDYSLFATGPENHIFIDRGIRSVGLAAGDRTLFTTRNPEIPLAVWVREVLKGNYRNYLEETAAAWYRMRRLVILAAPALTRFRELYLAIRDGTYRKKIDSLCRIGKTDEPLRKDTPLGKKIDELNSELDWLEDEYRTVTAEGYGLFTWKKLTEQGMSRPFFQPVSESKIRKLQECVQKFDRWEASFYRALRVLESERPNKKVRKIQKI